MHGRGNLPLSAALGHMVDQPAQSKVVHRIIMSLAQKQKAGTRKPTRKAQYIRMYTEKHSQCLSRGSHTHSMYVNI